MKSQTREVASAAPQRTAELSLGDVGHTALLYAALAGQTHVVQQLVEDVEERVEIECDEIRILRAREERHLIEIERLRGQLRDLQRPLVGQVCTPGWSAKVSVWPRVHGDSVVRLVMREEHQLTDLAVVMGDYATWRHSATSESD